MIVWFYFDPILAVTLSVFATPVIIISRHQLIERFKYLFIKTVANESASLKESIKYFTNMNSVSSL